MQGQGYTVDALRLPNQTPCSSSYQLLAVEIRIDNFARRFLTEMAVGVSEGAASRRARGAGSAAAAWTTPAVVY
ncbi:hypothetical protein EVAR_14955_1 [Eumeta japonica]|uniref:Uncharacterized protein n=1 Tax=Eumeta variegata TaxID=151549 RepID=A0A4C1XRG7_EUMVA|nr:hypothetical protein EVAR_14955_1 [Eumeta japonica]